MRRTLSVAMVLAIGTGVGLTGTAGATVQARPPTEYCHTVQEQIVRCGRIINASGTPIVAYMSRIGDRTPHPESHQRRLLRGQGTPANEDWDLVWLPCRAAGVRNIAATGANIPWTGGGGFHDVRDPETLTIVTTFC